MELLFLPTVIIAAYFLLVYPQQKRVRRHRELITSLELGDDVVTAGGILGTIKGLDEDTVSIEIASGTVMKVMRAAISHRHSATEEQE